MGFNEDNVFRTRIAEGGTVIVCVGDGGKLSTTARQLDKAAGGAVARAMRKAGFPVEEHRHSRACGRRLRSHCVGGRRGRGSTRRASRRWWAAFARLNQAGIKAAHIAVEATANLVAANIAYGAQLRSYRFDKYRTKEKADAKPTLRTFALRVIRWAAHGASSHSSVLPRVSSSRATSSRTAERTLPKGEK